jgi:hypothetical protein
MYDILGAAGRVAMGRLQCEEICNSAATHGKGPAPVAVVQDE